MFKPIDNERSLRSMESKLNHNTDPLASGGSYIGLWEQNSFTDVGISVQMDSDGVLYFDFSPDGLTVNTFPVAGFSIVAGIHEFHTAVKLGRYFRVRVTNTTATPQTYCRVYVYYGAFRQPNLPLGSSINDDSDCILTRAPYDPIEIARGNVQSVTAFSKFGQNDSVGTSITPITSSGFYRTPTSATALELVSSNANDTNGGTGAQVVCVIGLDSSWLEISESVTMNGLTPVVLNNSFLRVYRMFVEQSGTYADQSNGSHVGTLTLQETGGGNVWASIPLINGFPAGQSLIGAYTVPADKILYLETLELSSSSGKAAVCYLFKRDNVDDTLTPYTGIMRIVRSFDNVQELISIPLKGLSSIGPATDIGIMSAVGSGNTTLSCCFDGYLINV